jgi:hypothetical protein
MVRLARGLLLLACFVSSLARAQGFELLVMPGPLSKAHADLESDCSKCHTPFKRADQGPLCLGCHDHVAVAGDVREKRGFHGLSPSVTAAECRTCHAEHKGRDADIVGFEREAFRHQLTDYPLHDAHTRVACEACHAAGKPYRDAPSTCIGCHASDDAHHGKLGKDCKSCHTETQWSHAVFDHRKTDFPLEGRHADVACALCHPAERYDGTPKDCATCHVVNDVHRGRFGAKCESCHTPSRWKTQSFDHARKTRFPLTGKHGSIACEDCHTGGLYERKLAMDCLSCHKGDDVHDGRNGKDCQSCHGTATWKTVKFDHDRNTEFPLRGAHRTLTCETCHTGPVHEQKLGTDCVSCHRADDPHKSQLGTDCARCHGEVGWKEKVAFDHDLARFPLLGLHAVVSCEECHADAAYRGTERTCNACHAKDDTHARRLGPNCELCHTPNAWGIWRFDHTAQTHFALHGAHADVSCESCHTEAVTDKISLAKTCNSCHSAEDPHRGSFGTSCEQCHNEQSWREVRISR